MTYSNLEPVLYRTAAWITTYLQGYITNATTERNLATYPSEDDFPSIMDYPDAEYTPPALQKAALGNLIPPNGPFPYLTLFVDNVASELIGQNSFNLILGLKVWIAIQENDERRIDTALSRYIDGLLIAFGTNVTLDGLYDEIKLTNIEMDSSTPAKVGHIVADLSARLEIVCDS